MLIYGKNPIREALKSGKTVDKLYFAKDSREPSISSLIALAKEAGATIVQTDRRSLDKYADGGNHQGVVAQVTDFDYSSVEDIFAQAEQQGEKLLVVLLDGITDPHNLGAIIRSAECLGAHGVIIPKHRSVSVNDTAIKAASGATSYIHVAKVTNINDTIRMLKERNVWVYACDFGGDPPFKVDFKDNTALVIGSEGNGIKRLTGELCDGVVTIPECGKINSLNASVAAGIVLYEVAKQRL